MNFTCPVCFFDKLEEPPRLYNICDCCGTEFGNDDEQQTYDELRAAWINAGARWFFGQAPFGWNPWMQLYQANVGQLPYYTDLTFYGSPISVISTDFAEGKEQWEPWEQGDHLALAS